MTRPILADAFAHHVWATITLIDACSALDPAQLDASAEGTYGSIIDTMRHLVGGDASYLHVLTGGQSAEIEDEASLDLAAMRAIMVADGPLWADLVALDLDPDAVVIRRRDDGSESHAPLGIRLAQVIHHGSDHRSQICTDLTTIGVTPPEIDVWDYAESQGRLTVVEAPAGS